jgi:hypothetical protein
MNIVIIYNKAGISLEGQACAEPSDSGFFIKGRHIDFGAATL